MINLHNYNMLREIWRKFRPSRPSPDHLVIGCILAARPNRSGKLELTVHLLSVPAIAQPAPGGRSRDQPFGFRPAAVPRHEPNPCALRLILISAVQVRRIRLFKNGLFPGSREKVAITTWKHCSLAKTIFSN